MISSRISFTRLLFTLLFLAGAVAPSNDVQAQTTTGTIRGTVTSGGASAASHRFSCEIRRLAHHAVQR